MHGTNDLLTKDAFNDKFDCNISSEDLTDIHYVLKTSFQKVGLQSFPVLPQQPTQPLLINIARLSSKGCSKYYTLLTEIMTRKPNKQGQSRAKLRQSNIFRVTVREHPALGKWNFFNRDFSRFGVFQ